ncbi:hypothetical protein [Flavobacterium gawalongense]|nr:hypothetical protein [Flavobacterium gawalongense]
MSEFIFSLLTMKKNYAFFFTGVIEKVAVYQPILKLELKRK